ncbi:zinc finger protein 664-like isoform X1 [Periplaneta americana]|uniref:zinc finger protein 664-like isoform X1 n=2 Tax=Periplaneta americana TaxID=6978 RepID=UPI0037E7C608
MCSRDANIGKRSETVRNVTIVVMDVIKKEAEVDPLAIQWNDNTDSAEKKPLSEEGNLLDLHVAGIKKECVDRSYDLTSGFSVEESAVPTNFVATKCKAEEELCDLNAVKEEVKLDVMAEGNEILTNSFVDNVEKTVSSEYDGMTREEDTLTQCGSYKLDSLIGSDVSHSSIKGDLSTEGFVTSQSQKHNLRTHTLRKSFKCDICGKCFTRWSVLKRHALLHTGQTPFNCDVCGKCFTTSWNYNVHARIHTGERPYKCDDCGRCFNESGVLIKHARIHTDERPFKCDVCGKSFRTSGNLKIHAGMHTVERPFKCEACGKCFLQSSDLKRHALVHTGEMPFNCDVCGKSFRTSWNYNVHARIHTGARSFKCDVCGKCFSASRHLNKHAYIHTGEPFR